MTNVRQLDILFIGDSLTEYWTTDAPESWQGEFGSLKVVNLGRAGDTTSDALERLHNARLEHLAPRVTVVLIGTNDISLRDGSPVDIAERTGQILRLLRDKMPSTKVLLLGVLPREYSPASPVRETVRAVNDELTKLADDKHVFFLDIKDGFIDSNGIIPTSLMYDGVHLSEEGYAIWAEKMRAPLHSLLSQRAAIHDPG